MLDTYRLEILISLFLVIWLAFIPYLSILIIRSKIISEKAFTSLGGGITISYIFLHLLPELVTMRNEPANKLTFFFSENFRYDVDIFLLALIGFNLYYGAEVLARKTSKSHLKVKARVYYIHLFLFSIYNILISYTMLARVQASIFFAFLFALAIGIHLTVAYRTIDEHYNELFTKWGRMILVGSLLVGWIVAYLTKPISHFYSNMLNAFISGSILFNVIKDEVPSDKDSRYGWFISGVFIMAIILIFFPR